MRCSSCSEHVKPVVAIDIDGTLGDYHGHFIQFAEEYLGVYTELRTSGTGGRQYAGDESFRVWWCRTYSQPEHVWYDIKLAYRQGAQKRSMPVYNNAAYLIRAMRYAGAEVWVTTTRPYLRLDNVDPDTRAWLKRSGIPFDFMLYDERKYEVLANRVEQDRVIAVLDDLPEQVASAASIFGSHVPIFRETRYNQLGRSAEVPCVKTLKAAADLMSLRIYQWKELHD